MLPRYKFQKDITQPISMKRVCISDMVVYSRLFVNCFLKHLYYKLCLTEEIILERYFATIVLNVDNYL